MNTTMRCLRLVVLWSLAMVGTVIAVCALGAAAFLIGSQIAQADALEWITLKQQSGAYLIQHYGLIRTGEVVQHFTETWSPLQDGRWRQDVGPSRYTCISEVRMGQLHCSSPGAAKPTRDQREVYDLLNRVSTIQITPKGWVQSEMNDKVTK
jgi:hypothetical protein